jgi:hypothetical protein
MNFRSNVQRPSGTIEPRQSAKPSLSSWPDTSRCVPGNRSDFVSASRFSLLASRFSVLDLCCLWIISRFLFVFSFHVSRFSLLIFSRFFSVSFLNFVSRSSILDSRCSLPAASSCFPFLVSHCTLQVHYAVPENRNKKRNADIEYNNR